MIEFLEPARIATVGYSDLRYRELLGNQYVIPSIREDLMQDVLERWKQGKVREKVAFCRGS